LYRSFERVRKEKKRGGGGGEWRKLSEQRLEQYIAGRKQDRISGNLRKGIRVSVLREREREENVLHLSVRQKW